MITFDGPYITPKGLLILGLILAMAAINTLFLFFTEKKVFRRDVRVNIVFMDLFFSFSAVLLVNQLCTFLYLPKSYIESYHDMVCMVIYGYILVFRMNHWGLWGAKS